MQGTYSPDKTWGLVMAIFASLGIFFGGCLAVAGAGLFAFFKSAPLVHDRDLPFNPSTPLLAAGGLIVVIGIISAIIAGIQVWGGILVMKSRRLGFIVVGIGAAFQFALCITSMHPANLVNLLVSGAFAYYCYMRFYGKTGPLPLA